MDARSGRARIRLLGAPGSRAPLRVRRYRPSQPSAESGVAANGSFRFLAEHDGLPLAWSRCRPITWKLNSGGVDDAVVEVVRDAVGRMAASSGFAFADRGFAEV